MYAAKRLGRNQVRTADDPAVAALDGAGGPGGSREEVALAGTVEALAALVEARDQYTGQHTQAVARLTLRLALALGLEASCGAHGGRGRAPARRGQGGDPRRDLAEAGPAERGGVGADAPAPGGGGRRGGAGAGAAGGGADPGASEHSLGAPHRRGRRVWRHDQGRPYRVAHGATVALAELQRCAGTQYDPQVVAALADVLAADPGRPGDACGIGGWARAGLSPCATEEAAGGARGQDDPCHRPSLCRARPHHQQEAGRRRRAAPCSPSLYDGKAGADRSSVVAENPSAADARRVKGAPRVQPSSGSASRMIGRQHGCI